MPTPTPPLRTVKRAGAWLPYCAFAGLLVGACSDSRVLPDPASNGGSGPHREVISPAGATRIASYSSAIRTGNLIFFSGVIGTLPGSRELAAGGVQPELRQAMENLTEIMDAAGITSSDLVKCTVFLADIGEFDAMNEVYSGFFTDEPPARSTVGAAGLPLGARVELECIGAVS